MKQLLLLLLSLISICDLLSQDLSDNQLANFFNQTFKDYFSQKDSLSKDFYILKDSFPPSVLTDYKNFELHFIEYSQAYPLIKKNEISALYWANSKQISKDTIDILIGGWTVDFERVFRIQRIDGKRKLVLRNYNFVAWCGGTLGYIPQGRFVYLSELDKWDYISEKQIIDYTLKKYKL